MLAAVVASGCRRASSSLPCCLCSPPILTSPVELLLTPGHAASNVPGGDKSLEFTRHQLSTDVEFRGPGTQVRVTQAMHTKTTSSPEFRGRRISGILAKVWSVLLPGCTPPLMTLPVVLGPQKYVKQWPFGLFLRALSHDFLYCWFPDGSSLRMYWQAQALLGQFVQKLSCLP